MQALDRAYKMAKELTDAQLLAAYLKLELKQWAGASSDDKEDARDYRNRFLRLLSKYAGRYEAMDYKRELAYYVAMLEDREAAGTIERHIQAITANDMYLENLEIITECAQELTAA